MDIPVNFTTCGQRLTLDFQNDLSTSYIEHLPLLLLSTTMDIIRLVS